MNTTLNTTTKEWTADSLFEVANGYWKSCTFQAGVKLDIFTTIGDRQLTAAEITEELNLDLRAATMLLDALTAMELLQKTDGKYANTPSGKRLLSKDSIEYMGYMAIHHHNMVPTWAELVNCVKTGESVGAKIPHEPEGDEGWWTACIEGMLSLSVGYAAYLGKQIDLSGRKKLLDLGGGPGTYAVHFCLNNPELKATVLDLPGSKPIADRTIKRFGAEDQVTFVGEDFNKAELKQEYDVVWLSHVIHGENPENSQQLIDKAVSSLKPGGLIMVHDYYMNDDMSGPLHPALFALNMLLVTKEGRSYSQNETIQFLEKAGVKDIKHTGFEGQLDSGIIMGTV